MPSSWSSGVPACVAHFLRHPARAEVRLDHLRRGRDLLERALGDLDPVVERDDAIRDPLDDVHVVLDHEDRVAALGAQLARSAP